MSRGARIAAALASACLLVAGSLRIGAAAEPDAKPAARMEAQERAQLFIALLKRRAQRLLESRRAPPPKPFTFSTGVSGGYESNVNLDGSRKGDAFTEETVSATLRRAFTTWLAGEATYDLLATAYRRMTDSDLLAHSVGGTLQWQPHRAARLDLRLEYALVNFPLDSDSSFADQRVKTSLLLAQTAWLTHKLGWTYQAREYDTRKTRDDSGTPLPGANRQDTRHVFSYELQGRFSKTSLRLGGEWYRNSSNEHFQDYYDWDDGRIRGALTRTWGTRWLGIVSASQEYRNYHRRSVPAINVAERDTLTTVSGSLSYELNPHATVTYSVTYRYQDSNDPRLDFTDWIHQVGATISF